MVPLPKQNIASMFSGTLKMCRRNFGKLFLIFVLSFTALLLPVLFNLDTYVTQLHQAVQSLDGTTVIYTVIYIIRPLFENGQLELAAVFIWIIGVFMTPFFMGMAGRIASEDAAGRKCTLAEAVRWTLGQYKHLLLAYAIYYAVIAAFGLGFMALLYWLIRDASHLITDVWLNPVITMCIGSGAFLFLGTIYLPFAAMEEQKGSFHAYINSFKVMYSRSFFLNFPGLLLAAILGGAVALAVIFPVAPKLFDGQGSAMYFLTQYNSVMTLLFVCLALFSVIGVFLYIFAYNTYRNATKVIYRRENVNKTYRRKLDIVEPAYRRRIG